LIAGVIVKGVCHDGSRMATARNSLKLALTILQIGFLEDFEQEVADCFA
jgi:hypothetical protein